jgi:arsenate reductase (thioredoxin)
MHNYLFICEENIGRSQMAEGFYNAIHGDNIAISGGLVDSSKKYNGHPRPDVIQVMNEAGIDIRNQRIKQISNDLIEDVDTIVVFCEKEKCPTNITMKDNVLYFHVDDPPDEVKTVDVLRDMRDKIKQIVEQL